MSAGVGGGMMVCVGGEDLCDPLEMGSERKERQQQVPCYRAGIRVWGLYLENRRRGVDTISAHLLPWQEQFLD